MNSENKGEYIERIQSLDEAHQTEIMRVLSEMSPDDGFVGEPVSEEDGTPQGHADRELELEERISALIRENEQLQQKNASLQEALDSAQQKLDETESGHDDGHDAESAGGPHKSARVLEAQVEELKDKVDVLEAELASAHTTNDRNTKVIEDLTASVDKHTRELEAAKSKEPENDDDKERQTALVDRYKKKAEAAANEAKNLGKELETQRARAEEAERKFREAVKQGKRASPEAGEPKTDGTTTSPTTDNGNDSEVKALKLRIEHLQLELDSMSSAWYALASRVQLRNQAVTKRQNSNPRAWITQQVRAVERIQSK